MKTVIEKKIKIGKAKIRVWKIGNGYNLHINFGRYKKADVDTSTIYCSIMEKDKPYTEIWLDKQKKTPIGVEVMWDEML